MQGYITCLLAKGTEKVHILDRKDFSGGIVSDIEDALRFIERNTRLAYRIEGLKRQDVPEYPMNALREAITNAVMHRDWFIEGANVFVEIYEDRIEVVSPGGLPKGVTLAELGTKSVRRNALIADLLHRIGFIEKAGTGIRRIRAEARTGGYPEPVWKVNGFTSAIFRPNPDVRVAAEAQSGPSLAHDEAHGPMTEIERNILSTCATTPKSTQEILDELGYRSRTGNFKRAISRVLQRGFLAMTRPHKPRDKGQRYRLTEAGRRYLQQQGG